MLPLLPQSAYAGPQGPLWPCLWLQKTSVTSQLSKADPPELNMEVATSDQGTMIHSLASSNPSRGHDATSTQTHPRIILDPHGHSSASLSSDAPVSAFSASCLLTLHSLLPQHHKQLLVRSLTSPTSPATCSSMLYSAHSLLAPLYPRKQIFLTKNPTLSFHPAGGSLLGSVLFSSTAASKPFSISDQCLV